jgi:hypothetical protein
MRFWMLIVTDYVRYELKLECEVTVRCISLTSLDRIAYL